MQHIYHKPIMVKYLLKYLSDFAENLTIDCTLGEGGHAEAVMADRPGRMIGIEQDEEILAVAKERLKKFHDRVTFVHDNFHNLSVVLRNDEGSVTGIYFDLGISSFHYDASGRGFTFRADEPLDMRMDQRNPVSAADLVNSLSEEDLSKAIWGYGEEPAARRIAAAIVRERKNQKIERTPQLVNVITRVVKKRGRIHPATRTFQAIRILVNNELAIIENSIIDAVRMLKPKGRICVVSFHSLEDRIVKTAFRKLAGMRIGTNPEDEPGPAVVRIITKKPVVPDAQEVRENPRSRSAKLRVAEKIA